MNNTEKLKQQKTNIGSTKPKVAYLEKKTKKNRKVTKHKSIHKPLVSLKDKEKREGTNMQYTA